jgi:hypothetical protein
MILYIILFLRATVFSSFHKNALRSKIIVGRGKKKERQKAASPYHLMLLYK